MPNIAFPLISGVTDVANGEALTNNDEGNPVGKNDIIKKDIYIIRNSVNDKVYIGQSVDARERWSKHIWSAKNRPNNKIDSAMATLGIENFSYEVIESQIENYNEREVFWVKHYNSLYPNGYNMTIGGIRGGTGLDSLFSVLNKKQLEEIITDIRTTDESLTKIARKRCCSTYLVTAINSGVAYHDESITYPIRENNRYTEEKIKQIKYSLKYEYDKSISDIAKEYNVDISQISEINQGKIHSLYGEKYPLRSGKCKNVVCKEIVEDIINDLKNTDTPQKDIAKKYNVSYSAVTAVNKGRSFMVDGEEYPIRKNYQIRPGRKYFSPNEIKDIEYDLKCSKLSMREIAKKYECCLTTIQNINNGSDIRYKNPEKQYPLRCKFKPVSTICA